MVTVPSGTWNGDEMFFLTLKSHHLALKIAGFSMERCHFSCFLIGGLLMILKIGHDLLVENTSFPRPQSAAAAHRFMPRSRTALEITNWIQDNSNDLAGLKKTRWPHHKWHLGFEGWCLWLRFGKNLLFSAESLQKIFSGWVLFCKPTDPIYLGSNVILSASFTWQWFISQPREHIFEWEHMGKSSVIIIIILWVSSHPGHLQGQENRHSQSHQHWCHAPNLQWRMELLGGCLICL